MYFTNGGRLWKALPVEPKCARLLQVFKRLEKELLLFYYYIVLTAIVLYLILFLVAYIFSRYVCVSVSILLDKYVSILAYKIFVLTTVAFCPGKSRQLVFDSSVHIGLRMSIGKTQDKFNKHVTPEPIVVNGGAFRVGHQYFYLGQIP